MKQKCFERGINFARVWKCNVSSKFARLRYDLSQAAVEWEGNAPWRCVASRFVFFVSKNPESSTAKFFRRASKPRLIFSPLGGELHFGIARFSTNLTASREFIIERYIVPEIYRRMNFFFFLSFVLNECSFDCI